MVEFKVDGCVCNITTSKRHYAIILISDDSDKEPMMVKVSPAPSDDALVEMGKDLIKKYKEMK